MFLQHNFVLQTIESKLLSANPEDNTQEGGAVIVSQLVSFVAKTFIVLLLSSF